MKNYTIICGVKVVVGSMVRLIDGVNMYNSDIVEEWMIRRPVLYGYYVVRGFSINGSLLLEGVRNMIFESQYGDGEPGFRPSRFMPVPNSKLSQSDTIKESMGNGINVKIDTSLLVEKKHVELVME